MECPSNHHNVMNTEVTVQAKTSRNVSHPEFLASTYTMGGIVKKGASPGDTLINQHHVPPPQITILCFANVANVSPPSVISRYVVGDFPLFLDIGV